MFVAVIFLLSLFVVWTDWVAYRRYVAKCGSAILRLCVAIVLVGANLLPYVAVAIMRLAESVSMVSTMWILTIYTLLSLVRMALYCAILTIKNQKSFLELLFNVCDTLFGIGNEFVFFLRDDHVGNRNGHSTAGRILKSKILQVVKQFCSIFASFSFPFTMWVVSPLHI